ncbi:hypothetical protein TEA_011173 [Camellia sinensis var. sinensis]|uniref:Uncharacterized protein n=1 Tax=Camellia sinensis var. sinensis TaxID=542762 RepID=A0A4S4EWW6_CAMSN|nr:hypothetical protein TEA_011173 [Camellia sinensis var. sinensis]
MPLQILSTWQTRAVTLLSPTSPADPSTATHSPNRTHCFALVLSALTSQTRGCSNIKELPIKMGTMDSLTKLNANGTVIKDALPKDLSNLSSLQKLNLSNNPICSLPNCIGGLNRLQILELDECKRLQSVMVPQNLKVVLVIECTLLEKVTFQSFPSSTIEFVNLDDACRMWRNSREFDNSKCAFHSAPSSMQYNNKWENQFVVMEHWRPSLFYGMCDNIVEIMGLLKLEPIENIDMEIMNNLGLRNLGSMENPIVTLSSRNVMKNIYFTLVFREARFQLEADEDMMWLSYWKFENQLEGGDELNISVVGDENFQVKEVGVHLVYKEQEEKSRKVYGNVIPGNPSIVYPVRLKVFRLGARWVGCSICDGL